MSIDNLVNSAEPMPGSLYSRIQSAAGSAYDQGKEAVYNGVNYTAGSFKSLGETVNSAYDSSVRFSKETMSGFKDAAQQGMGSLMEKARGYIPSMPKEQRYAMAQAGYDSLGPDGVSKLNNKKGFTLVELLTVIGIISILGAILFPAFARAREGGRRAKCASNLVQIGRALEMYAQDFDGNYPWQENPPGSGIPAGAGDFTQLVEFANTYVKHHGVFQCPSDDTNVREINNGRDQRENSARASYDFLPAGTKWPIDHEVLADYDASKFPLVWDFMGGATEQVLNPVPSRKQYINHFRNSNCSDGGNVFYADGHARWLPAEKWAIPDSFAGARGNRPDGIPEEIIYGTP